MIDQWWSCYDDGWQGDIVPEAFSHPAKFSRGLIHRIYRHAHEMGWFKAGDWCLDPFAGVALGAVDALGMGLNWIGVELEEKFCKLGEQNIDLWNRQLRGWPNLGTARIIQGDSRNLKGVIEKADLIVSSPPFTETHGRQKKLRNNWCDGGGERFLHSQDYAHTPGNLANLPEGKFEIVVGSPNFPEQNHNKGWSKQYQEKFIKVLNENHPKRIGKSNIIRKDQYFEMPNTPGQLASMPEGPFDLCVGSPPYEEAQSGGGLANPSSPLWAEAEKKHCRKFTNRSRRAAYDKNEQGKTSGQLGLESGNTFWSASYEIVQQCFELLKPNGHAIWVCKDYCKDGKRIPFSQRWAALCQSVGFQIVCWHKAMLVKEDGEQATIRGNQYLQTEKKSFFRRNHETKVKAAKFWPTLASDLQDEFIELAQRLALVDQEKDPTFQPSDLSPKKILQKAQVLVFKAECLDDRPYRDEMMIDNEDVICMVKP